MYLVHESVDAQERRGADQHGAEPDARHHQLGRGLGHLQSHADTPALVQTAHAPPCGPGRW